MSTLPRRRIFWAVGTFLVLCNVLCSTYAGTSRGSVSYSRYGVGPSASSKNYSEYSRFMKRSLGVAAVEEKNPVESRRSVHDTHGRTLILKSLILAPLAMVVFILLLILLIPIPVISSPLGRSLPSGSPYNTVQMAREVLTADECVERMSCELSRISRAYDYTSWIPSTLERILARSKWSEKILRGLKGTSNPTCYQFTCSPAKTIKRSLNM